MITSKELKKYLDFAYKAYQENNITGQDYRQKGKVPYLTHPLGAAILLISDTEIPIKEREIGFKALILHDVLEDTSLKLPNFVESKVKKIVEDMTFENWEEAERKIPEKPINVKLLILYDKLHSMYEMQVGMNDSKSYREKKRRDWKKAVGNLINEVEKHYGNIRIVQIGKAIIENTKW